MLFDRGQREEEVLFAALRGIGCEVSAFDKDAKQWRVSALGGHFAGSLDGMVKGIINGSKDKWELIECKTHNKASFKELTDKGVKVSKYQHWCQMQSYLHLTDMTRANYIAVCKDNDEIYHERVHVDKDAGEALMDRAESVIFSDSPLPKISNNPTWYQCKTCQHYGLCHGNAIPLVNCRTCCHSTPVKTGGWLCERHDAVLSDEDQKTACQDHLFIPALMESWADEVDSNEDENWVKYRVRETGSTFKNGIGFGKVPSWEIKS